MSKKTRAEKREEERRIIAEMEAAMAESAVDEGEETEPAKAGEVVPYESREQRHKKRKSIYEESMPEKIHCKRCKTLMEQGVCPTCGYRIYVPMDKKKRDKIRLWVAAACIVGFVIIFVATQIANS